jgi:hypothetical protein
MYRWFREVHLFVGLLAFWFLLMYCLSSIRMTHSSWFPTGFNGPKGKWRLAPLTQRLVALWRWSFCSNTVCGGTLDRLHRQTLAFDWKSSVPECSIKLSIHGRREGLGYGLALQTSCRCWQEFMRL